VSVCTESVPSDTAMSSLQCSFPVNGHSAGDETHSTRPTTVNRQHLLPSAVTDSRQLVQIDTAVKSSQLGDTLTTQNSVVYHRAQTGHHRDQTSSQHKAVTVSSQHCGASSTVYMRNACGSVGQVVSESATSTTVEQQHQQQQQRSSGVFKRPLAAAAITCQSKQHQRRLSEPGRGYDLAFKAVKDCDSLELKMLTAPEHSVSKQQQRPPQSADVENRSVRKHRSPRSPKQTASSVVSYRPVVVRGKVCSPRSRKQRASSVVSSGHVRSRMKSYSPRPCKRDGSLAVSAVSGVISSRPVSVREKVCSPRSRKQRASSIVSSQPIPVREKVSEWLTSSVIHDQPTRTAALTKQQRKTFIVY